MPKPLGRLVPPTFEHVEKYPALRFAATPTTAEWRLDVPLYHSWYDQQREGACVAFGWSWESSIKNRRKYDAPWLYQQCKARDGQPNEEGTYLYLGGDVLRELGHRRVYRQTEYDPDLAEGIDRFEWARSVDEVRSALAGAVPVVLGINWYSNFDRPVKQANIYRIGDGNLGSIRGGHAICATGVSDKRQAIRLVNSWGLDYPKAVWLPYTVLERLLQEDGEAAVAVDRP